MRLQRPGASATSMPSDLSVEYENRCAVQHEAATLTGFCFGWRTTSPEFACSRLSPAAMPSTC